jgi:hypothetical protein
MRADGDGPQSHGDTLMQDEQVRRHGGSEPDHSGRAGKDAKAGQADEQGPRIGRHGKDRLLDSRWGRLGLDDGDMRMMAEIEHLAQVFPTEGKIFRI